MTRLPWHRVFHPLSGADPLTLIRLLRHGPLTPSGAVRYGVAAACAGMRAPFTLAEAALRPLLRDPEPPVFIVGHPRSGTTHLHNLMAASGCFATVPPVTAGMPWEALGLARVMRPFVGMYLPETRLIDGVRLGPDVPTEDEIALANLCDLSHLHALYLPRGFARLHRRGLLHEGATERQVADREGALRRYVRAVARPRRGPLLLKNPAYTGQLAWLLRLFPGARVVHIHRDPEAVLASARRATRRALDALALQRWDPNEVDEAILSTYPPMMEALLRDAAALPPHRLAHVAYEALATDPLGELEAVWRVLDLPDVGGSMPAVERYLASVAGYAAGGNDLPEPLRGEVRRRWGPVADRVRSLPSPGPPQNAKSGSEATPSRSFSPHSREMRS